MSYQTMVKLLEQGEEETKIFPEVTKKMTEFSSFVNSTKTFLSTNQLCSQNRNWNTILLGEKVRDFVDKLSELPTCILGGQNSQNSQNGQNSQNSKNSELTKRQRLRIAKCFVHQDKIESCTHCNKKCGTSMKRGNLFRN